MKTTYLFISIGLYLIISCKQGQFEEKLKMTNTYQKEDSDDEEKKKVADDFVNSYIDLISNEKGESNIEKWLEGNESVTSNFRNQYSKLVKEAYKEDPELGIGADAILDAQDYPDDGFLVNKVVNDYVFLEGKTLKQFTIKVKLAKDGGFWKIEGCGMVNME